MDKDIVEIKIESKNSYYFNLIKKNITTIFRSVFAILILVATLYIGFYVLLFFILLIGVFSLFNKLTK